MVYGTQTRKGGHLAETQIKTVYAQIHPNGSNLSELEFYLLSESQELTIVRLLNPDGDGDADTEIRIHLDSKASLDFQAMTDLGSRRDVGSMEGRRLRAVTELGKKTFAEINGMLVGVTDWFRINADNAEAGCTMLETYAGGVILCPQGVKLLYSLGTDGEPKDAAIVVHGASNYSYIAFTDSPATSTRQLVGFYRRVQAPRGQKAEKFILEEEGVACEDGRPTRMMTDEVRRLHRLGLFRTSGKPAGDDDAGLKSDITVLERMCREPEVVLQGFQFDIPTPVSLALYSAEEVAISELIQEIVAIKYESCVGVWPARDDSETPWGLDIFRGAACNPDGPEAMGKNLQTAIEKIERFDGRLEKVVWLRNWLKGDAGRPPASTPSTTVVTRMRGDGVREREEIVKVTANMLRDGNIWRLGYTTMVERFYPYREGEPGTERKRYERQYISREIMTDEETGRPACERTYITDADGDTTIGTCVKIADDKKDPRIALFEETDRAIRKAKRRLERGGAYCEAVGDGRGRDTFVSCRRLTSGLKLFVHFRDANGAFAEMVGIEFSHPDYGSIYAAYPRIFFRNDEIFSAAGAAFTEANMKRLW